MQSWITSSGTDSAARGSTLVLGIGNDILGDDGVGLLAARRVADLIGNRADMVEAAVATIDLVMLMAGYREVHVIDAFLDPARRPGYTIRTGPDDLPGGFGFRSFHTMPFIDALRLAAGAGIQVPQEVVIHGMVVRQVTDFTEDLTPEVSAAWEPWADAIATEIELSSARSEGCEPRASLRR